MKEMVVMINIVLTKFSCLNCGDDDIVLTCFGGDVVMKGWYIMKGR